MKDRQTDKKQLFPFLPSPPLSKLSLCCPVWSNSSLKRSYLVSSVSCISFLSSWDFQELHTISLKRKDCHPRPQAALSKEDRLRYLPCYIYHSTTETHKKSRPTVTAVSPLSSGSLLKSQVHKSWKGRSVENGTSGRLVTPTSHRPAFPHELPEYTP